MHRPGHDRHFLLTRFPIQRQACYYSVIVFMALRFPRLFTLLSLPFLSVKQDMTLVLGLSTHGHCSVEYDFGTGSLVNRLDSLTFRFGFGGVDKTWQSIHHFSVRHIRYQSWELDWGNAWIRGLNGRGYFHFLGVLRPNCFVLFPH
ncbi:hypothetical protein FOVG_10843 [Fusarium oxysporum f. sp. pisi HDV247]|uniref:Uncharacterized protein n=2 Tax=Fusarium oxysporum TaxID=5507 RepID=X0LKU1_FUSOX|nr:hypothetical protein FOVG_10843 [Fusarium oxysporum f. sp. pisi HDV247]EXM26513.1 hypothetical protein FOTG_06813 [Fusarium oxysporum f. sp. vasinfectum 25433]